MNGNASEAISSLSQEEEISNLNLLALIVISISERRIKVWTSPGIKSRASSVTLSSRSLTHSLLVSSGIDSLFGILGNASE